MHCLGDEVRENCDDGQHCPSSDQKVCMYSQGMIGLCTDPGTSRNVLNVSIAMGINTNHVNKKHIVHLEFTNL